MHGRVFVVVAGVLLAVVAAGASPVSAQSFGLGPRLSFVRGDVSIPDAESTRYLGGALRLKTSRHTGIEVSLDYRTTEDALETQRVRDTPIQGSVLLFPVRTVLAPYVLGGIGWYHQRVQTLAGGDVTSEESASKVGYHAGIGGELQLGKHAAIHLDYRYTFIRVGEKSGDDANGAVPIPGLGSLQERLKLSHEGSMWTTGLTLYF